MTVWPLILTSSLWWFWFHHISLQSVLLSTKWVVLHYQFMVKKLRWCFDGFQWWCQEGFKLNLRVISLYFNFSISHVVCHSQLVNRSSCLHHWHSSCSQSDIWRYEVLLFDFAIRFHFIFLSQGSFTLSGQWCHCWLFLDSCSILFACTIGAM